jgi:RNA polymerase sigma-70 factor (ECF subfamily)
MLTSRNQFPTTRWTLVLAAGADDSRQEALGWLCERYWQPIYAYIRRRGHEPAAAQDLTQGFLVHLIERRSIESADPERGRFRSYLIGALKHFLADRRDYDQALMRGGKLTFLPLAFDEGEQRYLQCPGHLSPEALYERQWAFALLDRVLGAMKEEHESAGKAGQFETLKPFLVADGDYRSTAAALGLSEGALRVSVHRLRRRYRELITAEISETVQDDAGVQQEIRHLIEITSA